MTARTHLAIRTGAVLVAMLVASFLLLPRDRSVGTARIPIAMKASEATTGLDSLPSIFGVGAFAESTMRDSSEDGRPKLIGVAGRLPDDAVALVRLPGESTQTMKVGDTTMEWRLTALEADRARFVRGNERYDSILDPAE